MHPDIWESEMSNLISGSLDGSFLEVTVGDQQLTCLAALSVCSRQLGLSNKSEVPEDGMIFICPTDSTAPFTKTEMSCEVKIWFYDREGKRTEGIWSEQDGTWDESKRLPDDGTWPGDFAAASTPYRYVIESRPEIILSGNLASIRLSPEAL